MTDNASIAARARWSAALFTIASLVATPFAAADDTLAFPGAMGPAASTPGGRGGALLRVTTLAGDGPGSLAAAIATKGPRTIVLEVGGVIDLARTKLEIREPFVTIAGQTAPSPGITLIRGGINVNTHDVVIRHLRVRPGEAGAAKRSGWDVDALSTGRGARDVIVDHCSFTWATDENLSASGPRFAGDTLESSREATSHRITFSHNIIAEGLRHSTHAKGEHSKGTLIHDHVRDVLIIGNLYAHNEERSPLFKGDTQGWVINNLIYNPGARAIHYNLIGEEWHGPKPRGHVTMIGNVLRAGPSTRDDIALFSLGGSGGVDVFADDNLAVDRLGEPLTMFGRYTTAPVATREVARPPLPPHVEPYAATRVHDTVLHEAGARPWDRDAIDSRIVSDTAEGRGAIIDSEQDVGGYPPITAPTRRPFDPSAWHLDTMEPVSGAY